MKKIRELILLCLFFSVLSVNNWELPVLPVDPDATKWGNWSRVSKDEKYDKLIPRHLWIAVRDTNEVLNYQLPKLFERNPLWQLHIVTNAMKDEFMNSVFANTSLLWAYHLISPKAGAAKADLWRYATLWMYGGFYVDDDSDIGRPLDRVVEPSDSLLVSFEKNGFNANRCYIPRFHLSDFTTYRNESLRSLNIFNHRCLLNWALASAPRHPIVAAVMRNAVEIIRHEYLQDSVLRSHYQAYRWEAIMCATGPSLLTASAREMLLQHGAEPGVRLRLANVDFKDYGGKFKAIHVPVKNDPKHYMNMGHKRGKDTNLLSDYAPEQKLTEVILHSWQNQAIQGQNGKEIFVVDNMMRRGIPNFDTFLALNFTMADVIVVSDGKLASIPLGPSMPKQNYPG